MNTVGFQFEGFYERNDTSYVAMGTIKSLKPSEIYVSLNYTCFLNISCIIDGCAIAGYTEDTYTVLRFPIKNAIYHSYMAREGFAIVKP